MQDPTALPTKYVRVGMPATLQFADYQRIDLWCQQHCAGRYQVFAYDDYVFFELATDALMFRLSCL